jgi:hypothetical protein
MSTVKLKRSAVQGKVPTTTDLELGELAINTYDGKLYLKKDDGTASIVDITNTDIIQDTTPQLGGDLDLNSSDITGTGNINITGAGTFSGNLTVDTNTLFVDAANNLVGIGTTTPGATLGVRGTASIGNSSLVESWLDVGQSIAAGSSRGAIYLYGAPTGYSVGSLIEFYTAVDHDTNNQWYTIKTSSEDWVFELANGNDILTYDYSASQWLMPQSGGLDVTGNITVGGTVDGRDVAADGTKLDGIEAGATADQTASEILTALLTVDGTGSGLDADLWDGNEFASYLDQTLLTTSSPSFTNITSTGNIYIGQNDTAFGQMYIYGNGTGSTTGGEIYLYTPADYDTNTEYYRLRVLAEDFFIQDGSGNTLMRHDHSANAWFFPTNRIDIGTNDTTYGDINVYGSGTGTGQGGRIRLYNAADYDTTNEGWGIKAWNDSLTFEKFDGTDIFVYNNDDNSFRFPAGDLYVGTDDVIKGGLYLFGEPTGGTAGGELFLYNSTDHQSSPNPTRYHFRTISGDFYITGNSTYLQYDASADQWLMPASGGLDVTGTITSGGLTVDTNTLHVDTAGNRVGIKTTSPLLDLHVAASSNTDFVEIGATSDNYATDFKSAQLRYYGDSATGDNLGVSRANQGSLTFLNTTNAVIGTNGGSPLIFSTLNAERMRIDSSGNVGIGTTSPGYTLEAAGTVASKGSSPDVKLVDTDGTSTHSIVQQNLNNDIFYHSTRTSADVFAGFNYLMDLGASGATLHRWYINGAEAARLNSNGRLGIGTTNPSTELDVVGDVTASGVAYINGGGISLDDPTYARHHTLHDVAMWSTNTSVETGAIAIRLGHLGSTFINATIVIFRNYNEPVEVKIHGYYRSGTTDWINEGAWTSDPSVVNGVRFALDSNNYPVVILSNNATPTSSTWSNYIQVRVTDVSLGWTGANDTNNHDPANYVTSLITSLTGYTIDATITPSSTAVSIGADTAFYNSALTSTDFYWDASASSLGIGTTTPLAPLQVQGTGFNLEGNIYLTTASIQDTSSYRGVYLGYESIFQRGFVIAAGTNSNLTLAARNSSNVVQRAVNINGDGVTQILKDVTLGGAVVETVYALSGTTPALDPANGTVQTWTLTAASTPTDSLAAGESMTLMIDDGTAYTITWPTITWVNNGGTAPTLATTGYTVIALWKVSTTLYGALVGDGT